MSARLPAIRGSGVYRRPLGRGLCRPHSPDGCGERSPGPPAYGKRLRPRQKVLPKVGGEARHFSLPGAFSGNPGQPGRRMGDYGGDLLLGEPGAGAAGTLHQGLCPRVQSRRSLATRATTPRSERSSISRVSARKREARRRIMAFATFGCNSTRARTASLGACPAEQADERHGGSPSCRAYLLSSSGGFTLSTFEDLTT